MVFVGLCAAGAVAQDQNKPRAEAFESRVKDYVKLREGIEA